MRTDERTSQGRGSNEVEGILSADTVAWLLESIHSKKPVRGFTHGFYRYPARFHPQFARAVIETFSKPGDTILDPFMGGGTTIVEGLTLGRRVIGVDINSLAVFIARVKSTPLSPSKLTLIREVIDSLGNRSLQAGHLRTQNRADGLFMNTPWWIRNIILSILDKIGTIEDPSISAFLQCALLKTAQWALDCRETIPTPQELFEAFRANVVKMCGQMEEYREALCSAFVPLNRHIPRYRRLLARSAVGVDRDRRTPPNWLPVKLVVTSPPYPGVHVLYHRWQVRGRRETPAPFAILRSPDGHVPSYYTFGDRRRLKAYFETLTAAYRSIHNILTPDSLVVQLVSFADPVSHIDQFLAAMADAGFEECSLREVWLGSAGRIWRLVPNRKWYAGYRGYLSTGKELLFFHRIRGPRNCW